MKHRAVNRTSGRKKKEEAGGWIILLLQLYFPWRNKPNRASAASLLMFPHHTQLDTHTHTHTHTQTLRRTPLDELSVCRRGLYLTTHNTHDRQT